MRQERMSRAGATEHSGTSDRVAHCASLERRLQDGYQRIDEAEIGGADVSEWEMFWIRLLREYEEVCREVDIAA